MRNKAKSLLSVTIALGMLFAAAGCGGEGDRPTDQSGKLQTIAGLDKKYYPVLDDIQQYSGTIDVEIVLEGAYHGWAAVAEEYSRLQNGKVQVNINQDHLVSSYQTLVDQACRDPQNSSWDIFQGNYSSNQSMSCYNLIGEIYRENPYAGSLQWTEVMEQDAYNPPDMQTNTYLYVMRSASIVTCWYVNMTAFNAAVAEGYLNADGKAEYPLTWDDLMSLCEYMERAGYENPLGISGNSNSLTANQFSWLTNVYGDQYYREMYEYININEEDALWNEDNYAFNYDPDDCYIEQDRGFNYSVTKLWNALLDENEEYMYNTDNYRYQEGATKKKNAEYVGAMSEKYACLLDQFRKMKDYLPADFSTRSVDDMEAAFVGSQSAKGKPMIFLDLTSCGLGFDSIAAGFEIGMFEYPYMVCNHEHSHVNTTTVRDVGGAGGFLSVLAHDAAQNELNVDFLMFFMSPYGQAIYTNALYEKGGTPDGISLVKHVQTPDAWKEIFNTISYDGPASASPMYTLLLTNSGEIGMQQNIYVPNMVKLLSGQMSVKDYQTVWNESLKKGWDLKCEQAGYNKTCWQRPGTEVWHSV